MCIAAIAPLAATVATSAVTGSSLSTSAVLSSVLKGVASMTQAAANRKPDHSPYHAAVDRNAAILRQQQATLRKREIDTEKARAIARQRARQGKSGVQRAGSPLLAIEELAADHEHQKNLVDHELAIDQGDRAARASLDRARRDGERRREALRQGTTLLTEIRKTPGLLT